MAALISRSGLISLLPRLKGQGGGEYSETRFTLVGAVVQELVAQSLTTFATGDLQSHGALLVLADTVLTNGLCECRPRAGVFELVGT